MSGAPDPTEILAGRARRLAQPVVVDQVDLDEVDSDTVLVIRLGDERVGVALAYITEVHRAVRLTAIPGARHPVIGVIAWRGRVLTVLDIALQRAGPVTIGETTRIVVIGQRRAAFGIIADEVEDTQLANLHDGAPVETVDPARAELIRGVTSDALVVLDVPALIARFAPTH
jgi:chemotaxis signal transduction protein